MARAVTRDGVTTIYGPGDSVAGSFVATVPIDADPESHAEATETDQQLRDHWVRLLSRWEPEVEATVARGESPDTLYRRIERSAGTLLLLHDLERLLAVQLAGVRDVDAVPESERAWGAVLRLLAGGRDARTIRRWRSGEILVPEGVHEYLSRIRDVTVIRAPDDAPYDEQPEKSLRLRIEILLD